MEPVLANYFHYQSVEALEQFVHNLQVGGSIPLAGSSNSATSPTPQTQPVCAMPAHGSGDRIALKHIWAVMS